VLHVSALYTVSMPEEIAIVGVGCRLPGGVETKEEYWQMLRDGVDALSNVPADRWEHSKYFDANPKVKGKTYARVGGFVERCGDFDASLFGIAPAAALAMDPQQRLLLETAWACLEDAGYVPPSLAGTKTGVFVAMSMDDYSRTSINSADLTKIDSHATLGNVRGFAAGRIAYTLGFTGPALLVDSTCSSSLTALHLASQSLRARECDFALVSGVHLILSPASLVATSKLRALSASGKCHTFDAAADGYVRGEGCVAVLLRRLSDAVCDGDPILAVVRATALNHNGRSNGLTAPREGAQVEVIGTALANAATRAEDVTYVEAHGTGTLLGDPIELGSLARVFGERGRRAAPLLIGSVKANIGHLEACAGLAGLVKVALSLHYEALPKQLHFHEPNPHFAWERAALQVVTELRPWPRTDDRLRIAGVSAFGMSGSNGHAVLAEAPPRGASQRAPMALPLLLSARSAEALRTLAGRYQAFLTLHPQLDLADFVHTASVARQPWTVRVAACVEDRTALEQALRCIHAGEWVPTVVATGSSLSISAQTPPEATAQEVVDAYLRGETPDLVVWGKWGPFQRLALPPIPFERRTFLRPLDEAHVEPHREHSFP